MRRLPLFLGLLVFLLSAETAAAEQFAVIVNAANGTAQLDSKAVKAHFLKTQASWSAGDRVRPIDQSDATVIKLVKTFKGAIGFVSKEAAETAGVKVVLTVSY